MAEIRVATYPGGLRTPARLEVSLGLPYDTAQPAAFAIDWLDTRGNVAFHFNPRPEEDIVVLNTCIEGEWILEERISGCPFKREPDASHLRFDVDDVRFRVVVDDELFCEFFHRLPPTVITEVQAWRGLWRLETENSWLHRRRRMRGRAFLPEILPTPVKWAGHAWVSAEDNPPQPDRLKSFRFFAVLGTWMEDDLVAATVADAFAEGCERVYLVDNGSDDDTVGAALAAGAVLARSFASERYDEVDRVRRMQGLIDEISAAEGDAHIWWLWLDADEFHHGPGGLTLHEYLETLDRRFRIVGTRYFNHFPTKRRAYVRGRHPLDFQPLCYELRMPWYCDHGHWKHTLQRWDREGSGLSCTRGFHAAASPERLFEPTLPVFCHHFPYREPSVTERRLAKLFGDRPDVAYSADRAGRSEPNQDLHMRMRYRSLDAVYRRRWEEVHYFPPCAKGYVPELKDFEAWVGSTDATAARWY